MKPSAALDAPTRAALVRVLEAPVFELLPLASAGQQLVHLPPGASVSVTASPSRGLEATIDLAERLAAAGHRAVPHLAARMVRDRVHLEEILRRMAAAGIDTAFVVGGDAPTPGPYADGLALIRELRQLRKRSGEGPIAVGIPCYPQGHPSIPHDRLVRDLAAKAPLAASMTSQMSFDVPVVERWVEQRRAEGLGLPLRIGLPGAVELPRLLRISAQIGVADARRFLMSNRRLAARFLAGGYRPDRLLRDLAPLIADPAAGVIGLHLFTFNQVDRTEAWRQSILSGL